MGLVGSFSRIGISIMVLSGLFASTAFADLSVNDSLNRYSLYGRKYLEMKERASTSAGGWVGSGILVKLAADDTIRSTMTTGQDFNPTNKGAWIFGDARIQRDWLGIYLDSVEGNTYVGRNMSIAHQNRLKSDFWLGESLFITSNSTNYFDGGTFANGGTTRFGSPTPVTGLQWGVRSEATPYSTWTFPETTFVTGAPRIRTLWNSPTDGLGRYRWTCGSNFAAGGDDLVALGICAASDTVLPPGNYADVNLWTASTLYLGEGAYTFTNVTLQPGTSPNGTRLLSTQPNGERTLIMLSGILNSSAAGVRNVIAPEKYSLGYYNATTNPNGFGGGTMMIYSQSQMSLSVNTEIWATVVVPDHRVSVANNVALFGQILADSIIILTDFKGADGAFIPYNPKPPVVTVSNFDATVTEGDPAGPAVFAKFLLTMDHINGLPVKVYYHTEVIGAGVGNAQETADFTKVTKDSVVIGPTNLYDTIRVQITSDFTYEPTERFRVVLDSSRFGTLGTDSIGVGTILDNDPPPLFSFVVGSSSGSETVAKPPIVVRLNKVQTDSVRVTVVDRGTGTATFGSDYTYPGQSETVVFAPGDSLDTLKTFTVVNDTRYEFNETIRFALTNPIGGRLDSTTDTTHLYTILDNEVAPATLIRDTSVVEPNTGTATAAFVVRLVFAADSSAITQAPQRPIQYRWATADSSATVADGDYLAQARILRTFPAGALTDTLKVSVNGDQRFENDERFKVVVDSFVNLDPAKSDRIGVGTIRNNDGRPALRIAGGSVLEPDAPDSDSIRFVVTLHDSLTGTALTSANSPRLTINYSWVAVNQSARAGFDFDTTGRIRTRSFAPGRLADTFYVKVLGDDRYEGVETFGITLTPGTNAHNSSASNVLTATGTINDDETEPGVCIADTSVAENTTPSRIRVFLASGTCATPLTSLQAPELPVRFSVATSDSTAKAPGDYATLSGLDSISPLTTSRLLSVGIVNDNVWEGPEVFKVTLSGLVNGTGIKLLARDTIKDDEIAPTVTVTGVSRSEGNSGTTTFPFVVKLSHRSELPVVFTWSTVTGPAPDSGTATEDLAAVTTRTDSVRVLQDSAILNVFVNGDTKREDDELFGVRVVPVTGITAAGSTLAATGTIVNDDAAPTLLSLSPIDSAEGNAGTKVFRFKLKLSAASGLPSTVTWSTFGAIAADSALAGEDFVGVTGSTVNILPLSDSAILAVTINGDLKYENNERFRVVATAGSGLTAGSIQAIGTIQNDDAAPVVSILDAAAVSEPVATGASANATFRVRLSAISGLPVTVDWTTVDSSARQALGDYVDSSGTLTFAPGDTSKTVVVRVLGDSLDEPGEYFRVLLTNALGATGIPDTAIGTITDSDPAPAIFVDDLSVDEPLVPGATTVVNVTIRLERVSGLPVSFSWSTRDSTARSSLLDYDSTGGATTVRIPAGFTSLTLPVTVRGDDVANEGNEAFRLALRNLSNATVGDTSGTVTIRDRTPLPSLSIASSDTVDEADLDIPLTITMSRPSATNVRVLVRTLAGTATSGADFRADSVWVTIPAGSTTAAYSTRVLEDNRYETSIETYQVRLDSAVGTVDPDGTPRVTIGIRDDEPVPTLSVTGTSVTEPAAAAATVPATATVTLSGPSELPITVAWATDTSVVAGVVRAAPTADYVATSGTLTFPADTLVQRFLVDVKGDSLDEFLEGFVVRLSSPTIATIAKDTGVVLITDDDAAPTLSVNDPAPVAEGGVVNFTARLQRPSAKDVRFVWTTFDSTATAGADYTARTSVAVTIPAGQTTATLAVTTLADALAGEGTEVFRVRLDSLANAGSGDTSGIGRIAEATGIPVLRIDSVGSFREPAADSSVVFKLTLSTPSAVAVRVSFRTVAGTATLGEDLVDTTGTVLIPAGTTSVDVPVRILADAFDEIDEETFQVELFAPESASIFQNIGTGSILDDDSRPSLSVIDTSVLEPVNAGDRDTLLVRVLLSAPSKREVRVDLQLEDSTAVSPDDYTRSGATLLFSPESTIATLKVAIAGDSLDEFLESFRALLSSPVNAILADSTGQVSILDTDAEPVLSLVGTTAREGDTAIVTVRLERPSAKTVVFDWTTVGGTATSGLDYKASGRTDTLAAGTTTLVLRVPVFADSIANEFSEQFRILVTRVVNAAIPDSDAVVVIDDQTPAPRLSVFRADSVVEDPVSLVFPIRLDRPSAVPVQVRWKSLEGTALAGLDFADTTGVLVIPAMVTSTSVSVRVLEDNLYEPWVESLQVVLSVPESAAIAIDRAPGFILDDNDNPPVVIDSSREVTEGGGARFPVRLLNVSADTVRVWVRHVDGTARAGEDFASTSRIVVFLPGDTVQDVAVATFVDTLWEPTESFALRIDSVQGGFVANGEDSLGHVVLREEGPLPTIEFLSPDTSVLEATAGQVPVQVRLSRAASIALSIGLDIDSASKAAFGSDFALRGLAGDTLEIPALSRGAGFQVEVLDDSLDEFDELVRLRLRVLGQTLPVGKTSLDLTILDDDEPPQIVFSVDSQVVDEGVGTVTVTARLSRPSGKIIDVWYSVSGTSTAGGVDHDMAPFHFTFRTGFDTSRVAFRVVDDVLDEVDETVVVLLDSSVNGNLASGQKQIVLIRDNDNSPKARFGDTLFTVQENVGTVTFPILLDHPSASDVVVRIRVGGTAIADSLRSGSDIVLDSTVEYEIRIPAGDTSATFVVTVIGDGRVESTESLKLTLRGGPGADPDAVSDARLVILDDDRYPDVKITGPQDSMRTKDPNQVITWTWDGKPQPPTDTTIVEDLNIITRCATDTAGNTGCDTIRVWGDFTPPKVTITVPVTDTFLTNNPKVRICWTVLDSGSTWRRLDSSCIDTTLTEGPHDVPKTACDSVGNCHTDRVLIIVDLTPPKGVYVFPPDSARIRVREQPALIRWIDDKDTIWVRDTLQMENYGWNRFTATYTDKAGNTGTTHVNLYFEAPQVQGGWYVDTNGDGKVDAAIVEFDSPWLSDTLPNFTFELGSETRSSISPKGWYSEGTRGTPALDKDGRVVVDAKGDTVYWLAGIPMLDKDGKPVIDSTTGKVLTSPVGSVWRDADGKVVHDAGGRELYRVAGPGTEDRTRMVVPLPDPFQYGVTSVETNDSGRISVSLRLVDSTGSLVTKPIESGFAMRDSVAPIITKAVVKRTEVYTKDGGRDTLVITTSEKVFLDSTGRWFEIKVDGRWLVVNPESVFVAPDGTISILVPPSDSASPDPGVQVRFLEGVTDSAGNANLVGEKTWSTKVEGDPRPPLLKLTLPTPVKSVPAEARSVTLPGGFVVRATDRSDTSQYQWWKPGYGYTTGSDPDIASVCPDLRYCNGVEMYVNRPVRMLLFVYDLAGTYVVNQEINISQQDIESLRADELDRVRIQLQWNMRSKAGQVVGSGIYLWRIVSWVSQNDGSAPIMTNQVVRVGVKSSLE